MNTVKAFYTKYLKPWVKALASAIGGAIAGLLLNLVNGQTAWPTTQQGWLTLVASTVLPAVFALFAPANKITQKQLDKDPNVVGGVVVPTISATETISDKTITTPKIGGQRPSSWQ